MSLAGRCLLVTRPAGQSARLMSLLAAEHARAIHFPVIELVADSAALATLPAQVQGCDWLIFVSPGAIDIAWPALPPLPAGVRLACVGAASAARLAALSGREVLHPVHGSDSDALLQLPPMRDIDGARVLIVRGTGGRATLASTLQERGASIGFAEVYRRQDGDPDWSVFDTDHPDAVILTSSEMVERLFYLAGPARAGQLQCLQYCVPHPRIAARLADFGVTRIMTTRADDESLVAGLREWFSSHP